MEVNWIPNTDYDGRNRITTFEKDVLGFAGLNLNDIASKIETCKYVLMIWMKETDGVEDETKAKIEALWRVLGGDLIWWKQPGEKAIYNINPNEY